MHASARAHGADGAWSAVDADLGVAGDVWDGVSRAPRFVVDARGRDRRVRGPGAGRAGGGDAGSAAPHLPTAVGWESEAFATLARVARCGPIPRSTRIRRPCAVGRALR